MQIAKLSVFVGFTLAALIGCSSSSPSPITTIPTAGSSNTTAGNGTGGSSGSGNIAGQLPIAGNSAGGAAAGTGGASTAGASGSAPTAGAAGGGSQSMLSEGCGKDLAGLKDQAGAPFTLAKGKWVELASQPDPNGKGGTNPPPMMVPCDAAEDALTPGRGASYPPCVGGMKKRGFTILLPTNFDNTKPSKVIYQATGCSDQSATQGGTSAYPYQELDQNSPIQVIQVGLEYSRSDRCYDNENAKSNDFKYFPLLHKWVESNFCVDKTKQYFSGYSTGAWVANQFTCAFPDVLHGFVLATGSEPAAQPTCLSGHPDAALFLHDVADKDNTLESVVPGCTRLLKQNGCMVQACDKQTQANKALVTTYTFPAGLGTPPSVQCVSFNGCPANAPVVFCQTNLSAADGDNHYKSAADSAWIKKLFWDFIDKH